MWLLCGHMALSDDELSLAAWGFHFPVGGLYLCGCDIIVDTCS